MGNLIESLIQTDTAVKSTTTSVVTDKDSTKSEPSLFDSLLKQNTPTTTTETTVQNQQIMPINHKHHTTTGTQAMRIPLEALMQYAIKRPPLS